MGRHSEERANLKFARATTNCKNSYCKLPTTVLRIAGLDGLSANLEFAEVTSNFYGSKAIYKGSEGFGPLNGGLAPEGLSSDIFDSRKPLKRHLQGFGAEATFEL